MVFDFDGVIAGTEPLYWRAWAELLDPFGINLSWDEYCRFGRGVKDEDMLRALPEVAWRPVAALLQEGVVSLRAMVRTWCRERLPICASTVRLLHSLTGFRLGLDTSSERSEVEPLLRGAGIDRCFAACVFREDVERHKPDPAPYIRIRKLLDCDTGVAFEDSEPGVQSAESTGFRAVRVAHPSDLEVMVRHALDC